MGIETYYQRVLYAGKNTEYERLISDYDIVEDCVVYVVLKTKGAALDPETDKIEVWKPGEKINSGLWLDWPRSSYEYGYTTIEK